MAVKQREKFYRILNFRIMKKKYLWGALGAILILALLVFLSDRKENKLTYISDHIQVLEENKMSEMNQDSKELKPPSQMIIDENKVYSAVLKTTAGDITIKLNNQATPKTVNNFVYLSELGFYDGVIFHRVIDGFMIQGGDPNGDGTGGPGYQFADEPFDGEYDRGTVAMANSGPNTNGSQFFIMHQDNDLPKNYVIFGQVIDGMAVVDKIATVPVKVNGAGENSTPVSPVVINSAEILTP